MRRFYTRAAGFCLDGIEQAGVLAADIGARSRNDVDVEGEIGAHDVFAQVVCLDCVVNRRLEQLLNLAVFAADIDVTLVGVKDIAGNGHALNDAQRVLFQQDLVLKGARLALIRVADDVFWIALNFIKLFPFFSGRVGSAAAAQQFCVDDLVDDLHRRHIHRLFQSGKAVVGKVIRHRIRTDLPTAGCQKLYCLRHNLTSFPRPTLLVVLS